jgi:hypothetical protein
VRCPHCLEANAEHRRFCHACGEVLPAFHNRLAGEADDGDDDEAAVADGQPRNTVWRRLTGTTVSEGRDNRTWRQRARDAGHRRVRYETGLSPKARLSMLSGAAAVVAVAALALGPLRSQVTGLLSSTPPGHLPAGATFVPEVFQGADPSQDDAVAVPGFHPRGAVDDNPATGVGFRLSPVDGTPEEAALHVALAETVTPRALVVHTGLPPEHPEVQLSPRPRHVEVCDEAGACDTVELQDQADTQRVPVEGLGPSRVLTVRVLSVHLRYEEFVPVAIVRGLRIVD